MIQLLKRWKDEKRSFNISGSYDFICGGNADFGRKLYLQKRDTQKV